MKTKTLIYEDKEGGEGRFNYTKVEKGLFAKVYSYPTCDKVCIVVDEECYDKEIVAAVHQADAGNPHIPLCHHEGYLIGAGDQVLGKVYLMKRYQKLVTGSHAKKEFNRIKRLLGSSTNPLPIGAKSNLNDVCDILEKCDSSDTPAMALLDICLWSRNYGDEMRFEYGSKNVMQDESGNIVWLDMVFSSALCFKKRKEQAKAREERRAHSYRY